MLKYISIALLCASTANAAPSITLTNDTVSIRSYIPAQPDSLYRGVRFIRCTMTDDIRAGATKFYGRLFENLAPPDPRAAITGLAEEFDPELPPGYASAPPDGAFLKIGVGILQKIDDAPYDFDRAYPLLDPGVWQSLHLATTGVVYRHTAKTPDGRHGADYRHALLLDNDTIIIERALTNTGTEPFATRHYAHHFISINDAPIDSAYSVTYGAAPVPLPPIPETMRLDGATLAFTAPHAGWIRIAYTNTAALPNRYRVWHAAARAGIEVATDLPVVDACVFATSAALSPEMFSELRLAPNENVAWRTVIKFVAESAP